jgi:regulator of protease activity HflC (stomatin/prohibitin superfamily)
VTEAEGQKTAAIITAEGDRQAAITRAEGSQQAAILAAEGQRQAQLLTAQGYSSGLEAILQVANHLDQNTLLLQYLDTLKSIGASPSTKFVVPVELAGLLRGLTGAAAPAVAAATAAITSPEQNNSASH